MNFIIANYTVFALLLTIAFRGIDGWAEVDDEREDKSLYNIGVGIYDATGPAAGVNLMGYANPAQINEGIHMRLYSRAFILDDGTRRVVFVSVDCGMMAQIIKMKVVTRLQEELDPMYSHENVILSGTHTHSGPAGFLQYLLFDVTSLGFIDQTMQAMAEGIYQSIVKAHFNMKEGYVYVKSGELLDASINRSPSSYANNPEEEISKYEYNTDKIMTLLRLVDINGTDLGMVNWFAVHGTSMNNTNPLISGDNKGYASQLFEEMMNPGEMPGQGSFVAAFAQSNCGDISPNTNGPKCIDTGEDCDILTSTCGGKNQMCIASGPGKDMMESTKIIGQKQFEKAWELYSDQEAVKLSGAVQFIQQHIDMGDYQVTLSNGTTVKTCEPALGYSFAAGTTDGPGAFDFTQGMTEENPFWNAVVDAVVPSRPEQIACQHPKPVFLDTGNYNTPYAWHPRIMDTQIGRVGQLFIIAVPGEFTTMAGRRMKNTISELAENNGIINPVSVISGLSNVYSHYITTNEEYAIQRYEGASTIFGPNTLEAYLQQYSFLLESMANAVDIPVGPFPPDLYDEQITILPGVLYDSTVSGRDFGDRVAEPIPLVYTGETQIAIFIGGHPRNDVRLGGTFLTVEREEEDGSWTVVATDASWETRFVWGRTSVLLGTGEATIYWDIPSDTAEGSYRINYYGNHRSFKSDQIEEFAGVTNAFKVIHPPVAQKTSYRGPFHTDFYSWFKRLLW